eukprot:289845-Pleurochrysis_carterae.AAC.1
MVAGLRLPSGGVDLCHRLRLTTAHVALVLHNSPCRCTSRYNRFVEKIGGESSLRSVQQPRLLRKHSYPVTTP